MEWQSREGGILEWVLRDSLSEEVTYELRLEWQE